MKGKIGDKQRLLHIVDAIYEIEQYVKNADLKTFHENSMMRFASVKQLEIIGEAANYITKDTKDTCPQIAWPQIIGMRHILVHEYFGIDTNVIWQVITHDLPELKNQITIVLNTL